MLYLLLRPHLAKATLETLSHHNLKQLIDYPANSPDLNTAEQIISACKSFTATKQPKNRKELKDAVIEFFNTLRNDPINKLKPYTDCMVGRLERCIEMNGDRINTHGRHHLMININKTNKK